MAPQTPGLGCPHEAPSSVCGSGAVPVRGRPGPAAARCLSPWRAEPSVTLVLFASQMSVAAAARGCGGTPLKRTGALSRGLTVARVQGCRTEQRVARQGAGTASGAHAAATADSEVTRVLSVASASDNVRSPARERPLNRWRNTEAPGQIIKAALSLLRQRTLVNGTIQYIVVLFGSACTALFASVRSKILEVQRRITIKSGHIALYGACFINGYHVGVVAHRCEAIALCERGWLLQMHGATAPHADRHNPSARISHELAGRTEWSASQSR